MAQHAKLSPSAASRWMACPGSVRLCADVPRKSSSYADEGTAAHALAEACLQKNKDARYYLGRVIRVLPTGGTTILSVNASPAGAGDYEVTEDMANNVQVYLDAVREPGVEVIPEQRLSVEHVWDGMFGTCDAQALDKDRGVLHVYDLKYGAGVLVQPESNPQAMIYALGALGPRPPKWVEQVRIVIVQPRHRDGGVMDWTISKDDLLHWARTELVQACEAANHPDAPLVPGTKQCRFCAAKASCPALLGESLDAAQMAFKEVVCEPATPIRTPPDPVTLTDEQIARILAFSEVFGSWVDAVHAHAESLALAGNSIPGYKLVRKKTLRRWKNEDCTVTALAPALGESLYDRKLKSPAAVEKLLPKEEREILKPLWESPEGDLTLVPESDKRQAVLVDCQLSALADPFDFSDL